MAVTEFPIPAHPSQAHLPTYLSATICTVSNPCRRHWYATDDSRSLRCSVCTRIILKLPIRGIGGILYNLTTLGIPSVYHHHYGYYPRPSTRGVPTLGLPDVTIYDHLPIYDPTLYGPTSRQRWEETFRQIAAGWQTLLAVSSTAVLGCVVGFVQLLTACNSAVYRTVVLSAFILVWASFVSGTYYIGHRDNFLDPAWSIRWEKAACNDYRFWTLMALPALLSAWAGILCIFAIVVVAVTGFCESRVKLDGPLVASCVAVALAFIVALSLIWKAVKRINASPNMQ